MQDALQDLEGCSDDFNRLQLSVTTEKVLKVHKRMNEHEEKKQLADKGVKTVKKTVARKRSGDRAIALIFFLSEEEYLDTEDYEDLEPERGTERFEVLVPAKVCTNQYNPS